MKVKNAIVGQSGGPTAAINATLSGVIRGCRKSKEVGILYGMKNGVEGLLEERLCNLSLAVSDESDNELLENTPSAALGSCRIKLPLPSENEKTAEDISVYEKIFGILNKYEIGYFFYIGGNDSMDTVKKLSDYAKIINSDIRFIGIPKTIDNDLVFTDHTPGFGSAAKYIAVTVQEIIRDCLVYTKKAVTIIEIMGRDTGWLTASSALPRLYGGVSPDFVYLPEVPFSEEEFLKTTAAKLNEKNAVVIAVSEGLQRSDGSYVGESLQSQVVDVFNHKYLSGTGKALELLVKDKIRCKTRSIELNTPQRCASHLASKTDIFESIRIGIEAVSCAVSGITASMIGFERVSNSPYRCDLKVFDVSLVANRTKKVPLKYINKTGDNITEECLNYISPLIVGEIFPTYQNGIPRHFVIE